VTDSPSEPHGSGGHDRLDQAFWDERYRSRPLLWSGRPNLQLVAEVEGLPPGTALDVGAGEGADAIWLAQRGWRVTAVDLSPVALERAAAHAAEAGPEVAARIDWQQRDILEWEPPAGRYDLVSTQYLHLPPALRRSFFERLAASVGPGGTLLVVGHHPSDLQTSVPRPPMPELFFTGEEVAAALEGPEWEVVADAAVPYEVEDPDGRLVVVHDTVFRARRAH
jgi:SAM-dependent methyltransferase